MSDVTHLLDRLQRGDPKATGELLPLVYEELRKLAATRMANEPAGQTLQATALVHEAWLRLAGPEAQVWNSRYHSFAAAAEAMRRILIDNARRKQRPKHGHGWQRVDLDQVNVAIQTDEDTLLLVNEALTRLELEDPQKAELVKLRYFAGMTIPEAGRALGLSESTAKRIWTYARAFLLREVKRLQAADGPP
jgi:RNA polymerase sigma factor (TIGR02999 family)